MIIIRRITHKSKHIKMEFLCVIEMGEELPSQGNARCLYSEGGDEIINLRRRSDGKDVE